MERREVGALIYGRRWSRASIEHRGRASERYSAPPAAVGVRGRPVYAGVRWAAGSIRGAQARVAGPKAGTYTKQPEIRSH